MASATEASLISKLETLDCKGIYPLFSDHLHPFSDLTNPKKSKKSTKLRDDPSLIRSLAKKFLPFLNRTLSVLPKRLAELSKLGADEQFSLQFFDIYKLCLDCLESVSSQLSCKPYSVNIQRVRMAQCLEAWGRYKEAEVEGFRVLESLRGMGCRTKMAKWDSKFLPDKDEFGGDNEFGFLVVEIVVMLVKCAAMYQSRNAEDYRTVLGLVEEVRPWFRVLDDNAHEKMHKALVTYMHKCTLFLVGEVASFDGGLVGLFCSTTLMEYGNSSMKDEVYKLARRICSSLFSLQQSGYLLNIEMLIRVLDSVSHGWKVEVKNTIEFLQLVSYCVNKCQSASVNFCGTLARHLEEIAGFHQAMPPHYLMLKLYAIGLRLNHKSVKDERNDHAIKILHEDGDILQNLDLLLDLLGKYFHIECKEESSEPSIIGYKDPPGQKCLQFKYDYEALTTVAHSEKKAYLLSYLEALKFVCQPLAELVNGQRRQIITGDGAVSVVKLCHMQNVLYQLCDVFLSYQSCTSEQKPDGVDENYNVVLSVFVAAFTISFKTEHRMKRSMRLIKHIISSEWIQPHGLKHLFASLNNIGVIFYRNKQLKEASKALKLCCRASWTCVIQLSKMFVCKTKSLDNDISEDAITSIVDEALTRSMFLVDLLHQCDCHRMKKTVTQIFEYWFDTGSLFRGLPVPAPLVKQWVKMQCKQYTSVNLEESVLTLHCLLSSSKRMSKETIGIILEQELVEYDEIGNLYPQICQKMQLKIISILLRDVYVTTESSLKKANILIKKARALRVYRIVNLEDCIQCLSEAISLINQTYGGRRNHGIPCSNQLAIAYSLRALCTQEAEPNSKQILQDINAAVDVWLSIFSPDHRSIDDQCYMVTEYMMLLLYNVIDLLSIKGCMDFHHAIYNLMIRLFKAKNVQLEKCLAILWGSRRITHALCVSPINEAFITCLSEHLDKVPMSIDFWTLCLRGSKAMLVGFQQTFSFISAYYTRDSCNTKSPCRLDVTVDEVKEAASQLISSIPVSKHSIFLVGHLYYDLCERLVSNGRLIEALSCAKEAHRLRTKLFQDKFMYNVEQQTEKYNETGNCIQKPIYGLKNLQVHGSVSCEYWSFDRILWDLEDCYLSPWNVLQCYLESTLQVGMVNEIIGNGTEAETFLAWGKNISCSQSLPLFTVVFSSYLGKLYLKKQFRDLAEKELQYAKRILIETGTGLSCLKCRLMLEVTVDQNLGDLSRSTFANISVEKLLHAETLYTSALDKLNLLARNNSSSFLEDEHAANDTSISMEVHVDLGTSTGEGPKAEMGARKYKRNTNAQKALRKQRSLVPENTSRITRSRYRSSQNQCINSCNELQAGLPDLKDKNTSDCSDTASQKKLLLDVKDCVATCASEVSSVSNEVRCWQCHSMEIMKSPSINHFIHMKWEHIRRRLLLRLLMGIGKCLGLRGQIHEAHQVMLKSMSVLVSKNMCHHVDASVKPSFLLDLIGKEIPEDVFAVERAAILYNTCWLSLKTYRSDDARIICCSLSQVQLPMLVSWLRLAFVLCREVPLLLQKVSRLLAIIYIISSSSKLFSLSSSHKALSESHWASYFHQASLGTHLNYQFVSNVGRCRAQDLVDAKGFPVTGSTCSDEQANNYLRIAPDSAHALEEFVMKFFLGLPCVTIVCVSLLGSAYASLLQDLLLFPSCVQAWILVSRLSSKNQPFVFLVPVDSVLEESSDDDDDDSDDSGADRFSKGKVMDKNWHCPWALSVVDDVAPAFKMILRENYLSSSMFPLEDTKKNRLLWWRRRKKLDVRLGKLMRMIEDSWLGPWRIVFQGDWSNRKPVDSVYKKLVCDLKSKCRMDLNESLLKIVLESSKDVLEVETCCSQLYLKKGCYIGSIENCDEERRFGASQNESSGMAELSELALQLIHDAINKLEGEDNLSREPIILVLDCEVQMLPWENIPILRNQEVYRMPSVGSISATLHRNHNQQEQVSRNVNSFPSIDPLDAFYLLNPSGDLNGTQVEFENWFRDLNLEGKAGSAATTEELVLVLKSHDLFIYLGHGSGAQYISRNEVQKLQSCAATLLMGCSSGSLTLNGYYIPQGMPLSYLLAGSPFVVANLWEVTDKDIDRFGKAMLEAWLRERSSVSEGCAQCNLVTKEFEAMNISTKERVSKRKTTAACKSDSSSECFHHRPKVGSFMGQAREACTLRYLIGASPVCYGVPTGITRKKDQ